MKSFLKIKIDHKFLILSGVIIILFITLAYFIVVDAKIRQYINENKLLPAPVEFSPSKYPVLTTEYDPGISALAALVMDDSSKRLLFAKNVDLLFSMASTTKIMTALVAISHFDMNEILTVKTDSVEGGTIGLKIGQKMRFEDLLYAMMLPSANDAAKAIADNYPGGEKSFVNKMNEYSKELNLHNTHFADPIGLLDERDYTTPIDLARLTSVALKNEEFSKTVATKSKLISDVEGVLKFTVSNLNELLGVDGVNGVKTGYTDGAGQVLVTSKDENGRTIISVVMSSEDRFLDTRKLLNMISGNISYLSIHP